MADEKVLHLQLFADGGEGGGEGADAGVSAADAGQSQLLELGVPAEKIRKRAKKAAAPVPEGAFRRPEQQDAAAEPTEPSEKKPSLNWEEVKEDPDIKVKLSEMVSSRVAKEAEARKSAEGNLAKLAPIVEVLARRYGEDMANPNIDRLVELVENDDEFFEGVAMETGLPMDQAKKQDQENRAQARQQRTLEQEAIARHIQGLEQQGEALKQLFPSFDLRKELQNPTFSRLTAPNSGLSLEDAYYAVHRKEIQAAANQVTARKTAEAISQSIQAGQKRPDENGSSSQAASVSTFDYSKASKEQREAIKREIRAAAARGEKLYPR